jgi:hypothetical protein
MWRCHPALPTAGAASPHLARHAASLIRGKVSGVAGKAVCANISCTSAGNAASAGSRKVVVVSRGNVATTTASLQLNEFRM